jgi:hypothetical protein
MKRIKNSSIIVKLFVLVLCVFIESCNGCGFSERCYEERERKRFLDLSAEKQKETLEECKKRVPISCYTYSTPTSEELKNKKIK